MSALQCLLIIDTGINNIVYDHDTSINTKQTHEQLVSNNLPQLFTHTATSHE